MRLNNNSQLVLSWSFFVIVEGIKGTIPFNWKNVIGSVFRIISANDYGLQTDDY